MQVTQKQELGYNNLSLCLNLQGTEYGRLIKY